MPHRRDGNLVVTSEIADEIQEILRGLDVSAVDLRRFLSDQRIAAEVAAIMRGEHPVSAAVAFAQMIAAGRFVFINPAFDFEGAGRWANRGDRVRGDAVVIDGPSTYLGSELPGILERQCRRPAKKPVLATAYELLDYAHYFWNGRDLVVAFGSVFTSCGGCRYAAFLRSEHGDRALGLSKFDHLWYDRHRILCVEVNK